ncbi:MAG: DsrE family protein [Actinomycetota bacterium]|nr:DsrE family protein [Actinomycetota bacterium]
MAEPSQKLVIIWSSADREVAKEMVFMYGYNSKKNGWWEDITLIVWGPATDLLSQDYELQEYIFKIKEAGIKLEACKTCADDYGVASRLNSLGIEVKYMGEPLTQYLKEGRKILTF